MPQLLQSLATRLADVLVRGRGQGSPGTAGIVYLPANRFRSTSQGQSLRDAGYPYDRWDRTYYAEYQSIVDEPQPANPMDGSQLRYVRFDLLIGYVTGKDASVQVWPANGTTEDKDAAVRAPRVRALSDAERVATALCCPDIFRDADPSASDPALIDCWRDGESTLEAYAPGQLLSVTPYRVLLSYNLLGRRDP